MNTRASSYLPDRLDALDGVRLPLTRLGAPLLYAHDANTFFKRMRGLHALPPLGLSDALVIRPCWSVQSYGMKYTIDAAFLNADGRILKLTTLKPGGASWCFKACIVVEMHEGAAKRLDLDLGQQLLPDNRNWS